MEDVNLFEKFLTVDVAIYILFVTSVYSILLNSVMYLIESGSFREYLMKTFTQASCMFTLGFISLILLVIFQSLFVLLIGFSMGYAVIRLIVYFMREVK